jgi:hypothetical protein
MLRKEKEQKDTNHPSSKENDLPMLGTGPVEKGIGDVGNTTNTTNINIRITDEPSNIIGDRRK